MEAPTAVTDKFPLEIYGDNLLKTLKKKFLEDHEMILTGF